MFVFSCFFFLFLSQVVKKSRKLISHVSSYWHYAWHTESQIIFLSEYIKRINLIDSLDLNSWIFLQNISSMRTGILLFVSL